MQYTWYAVTSTLSRPPNVYGGTINSYIKCFIAVGSKLNYGLLLSHLLNLSQAGSQAGGRSPARALVLSRWGGRTWGEAFIFKFIYYFNKKLHWHRENYRINARISPLLSLVFNSLHRLKPRKGGGRLTRPQTILLVRKVRRSHKFTGPPWVNIFCFSCYSSVLGSPCALSLKSGRVSFIDEGEASRAELIACEGREYKR